MPLVSQSSPPKPNDPTMLSESVRDYYRLTWGFDPVKDLLKMDEEANNEEGEVGCYYYEARLPLEHDLDLKNAGVYMIARVVIDKNGESHNRLGFACGTKKEFIKCIHTAIFSDTPEKLAKLSPRDYRKMLRTTEGHLAIQPPWEHFVSLKSFAAGLIARGVLSKLFRLSAGSISENISEDEDWDSPEWGEYGIFNQLTNVLCDIVADIAEPLLIEHMGNLLERLPEDWIRTHAEHLFLQYKIELLFGNKPYLASVGDATLKKLLILFLYAYLGKFDEEEFTERISPNAAMFFDQISEGKVVEELDLRATQDLLCAIGTEKVQPYSDYYKAHLEGILGKIFRKLFAREDPRLYDPAVIRMILGDTRDPLGVKDVLAFQDFDKCISDDFLSQLLKTIFQIWGDQPLNLGYMPYFLVQHFLLKRRDPGLLKNFLLSAPYKWLKEYWPALNNKFNLATEFLNGSESEKGENQGVRKIVDSLVGEG